MYTIFNNFYQNQHQQQTSNNNNQQQQAIIIYIYFKNNRRLINWYKECTIVSSPNNDSGPQGWSCNSFKIFKFSRFHTYLLCGEFFTQSSDEEVKCSLGALQRPQQKQNQLRYFVTSVSPNSMFIERVAMVL